MSAEVLQAEPCGICLDVLSPELSTYPCGHTYCRECSRGHLAAAAERAAFPLGCPACRAPVSHAFARELLPERLFAAALRAELEAGLAAVAGSARVVRCRKADCPGVWEVPEGSGGPGACFVCGAPAPPAGPAEPADPALAAYVAREGTALCPHCGALVEKTDGCNSMLCRCGGRFCYLCDAPLKEGAPFSAHGSCPQFGSATRGDRRPRSPQPGQYPAASGALDRRYPEKINTSHHSISRNYPQRHSKASSSDSSDDGRDYGRSDDGGDNGGGDSDSDDGCGGLDKRYHQRYYNFYQTISRDYPRRGCKGSSSCSDRDTPCGKSWSCGVKRPTCGDKRPTCGDKRPTCGDKRPTCGGKRPTCGIYEMR